MYLCKFTCVVGQLAPGGIAEADQDFEGCGSGLADAVADCSSILTLHDRKCSEIFAYISLLNLSWSDIRILHI